MSYTFEGRTNSNSDWVQISQGDLPWKSAPSYPRNDAVGYDITSSFNSGDNNLVYTDISFENSPSIEYMEYKITWTELRNPSELAWQLAEIEVPGLLGEAPTMPVLGYVGDYVASVVQGSTDVYLLGGYSSGNAVDQLALDGSTGKFILYRQTAADVPGKCPILDLVIVLYTTIHASHDIFHSSFLQVCGSHQ